MCLCVCVSALCARVMVAYGVGADRRLTKALLSSCYTAVLPADLSSDCVSAAQTRSGPNGDGEVKKLREKNALIVGCKGGASHTADVYFQMKPHLAD